MEFAISLVAEGTLTGLMYSLIALGFVLIYKSTDAINFAQGEFVMIAAIVVAGCIDWFGFPLLVAVLIGFLFMVVFGMGLERFVLRPMIGMPIVSIIMATIGLAFFLRGFGPLVFGAAPTTINLPIPDSPIFWGPLYLKPIMLVGAGISILFLLAFGWFFLKSRAGVAMRAVADSHQVSMAMGINVERFFAVAWITAGIVALLGGLVWGNMIGVDTQLALVGLKVFPVVILGGLDSIIGVVVGGIIVGVVEALTSGFIDPMVGGGMKDFAPYVLMIVMLMIRPYGIFGRRLIERI
ncbi:MAG: branched-chain amino acid ABC transporter permease [Alphaproteobacteria bacterium]|nr:branched-chain amino acid ABC transporter permease [Alphaproteobacteria bacterium]MCB9930738.1 branched-chain amino acid ABC transporter permease [Alphaproteobacteria bacterium]